MRYSVRDTMRNPVSAVLTFLLRGYKRVISPLLPSSCRFVKPSSFTDPRVASGTVLNGSDVAILLTQGALTPYQTITNEFSHTTQ